VTSGFSAVSDELHQVARKIGEAVGEVTKLVWQGPSGDYGHPGVQSGWERFIEEMKSQIETQVIGDFQKFLATVRPDQGDAR
jgi:hypothetical protein